MSAQRTPTRGPHWRVIWPLGARPVSKTVRSRKRLGFESSSLLDSSGTSLEVESAVARSLPAKECVASRPWRATRPTSADRRMPEGITPPPSAPILDRSITRATQVSAVRGGDLPTRVGVPPAGARLLFTSWRRFLSGSDGGLGSAGGCKPLVLREYEVRFLRSPPRRGPSASLLPLKLRWWSAALVTRKSRFDSGQGLQGSSGAACARARGAHRRSGSGAHRAPSSNGSLV